MAVNRRVVTIAYPASGDLSSNQFRAVSIDSDGRVAALAVGTIQPLGVLMNKPGGIRQGAEVAVEGAEVKIEAGAALNPGDKVVAVTGGRGSALASGGTAWIIGLCTQAASGSGAFAGVLVRPQYVVGAA